MPRQNYGKPGRESTLPCKKVHTAQSKIGKLTFKGLTSLFKNGMKIKKC